MTKRPTADQFIAGQPVPYISFSGAAVTAHYQNGQRNGLGAGSLQIKNASGKTIKGVLMSEDAARTFYLNLDREA